MSSLATLSQDSPVLWQLSREELDASELDLLIDAEMQSTAIDAHGKRRVCRTTFVAESMKTALLRRRDDLRLARASAEAGLLKLLQEARMHVRLTHRSMHARFADTSPAHAGACK